MHTGQIINHLAAKLHPFFGGKKKIQLLHLQCNAGFGFVFRQRKRLSYPKWMGAALPKLMETGCCIPGWGRTPLHPGNQPLPGEGAQLSPSSLKHAPTKLNFNSKDPQKTRNALHYQTARGPINIHHKKMQFHTLLLIYCVDSETCQTFPSRS